MLKGTLLGHRYQADLHLVKELLLTWLKQLHKASSEQLEVLIARLARRIYMTISLDHTAAMRVGCVDKRHCNCHEF